jgi:predicted nuclease of restriction endonuclease-like (RecB) superfamily
MDKKNNKIQIDKSLIENIKEIIINSRTNIARKVNHALIATYWQIGSEIVANEKRNKIDNKSSRQIILSLSKQLTKELGKGFSRSNLFNMRKFFIEYPSVQALSGQLNWSHICELLIIEDKDKRKFYEKEIVNSNWSIRELKRQLNSSLYERLLLSEGKPNKEKVLNLAKKGQELTKAEDIIKSPYVFEFLGVPENKPLLEKDLESKLIRHIEEF